MNRPRYDVQMSPLTTKQHTTAPLTDSPPSCLEELNRRTLSPILLHALSARPLCNPFCDAHIIERDLHAWRMYQCFVRSDEDCSAAEAWAACAPHTRDLKLIMVENGRVQVELESCRRHAAKAMSSATVSNVGRRDDMRWGGWWRGCDTAWVSARLIRAAGSAQDKLYDE